VSKPERGEERHSERRHGSGKHDYTARGGTWRDEDPDTSGDWTPEGAGAVEVQAEHVEGGG
jgi:hypothetical protein